MMDRRSVAVLGGLVVLVLALTVVVAFRVGVRGSYAAGRPIAEAPPEGDAPPQPVGQRGGWEMAFSDEFDGTSLDPGRWTDRSSAEADHGHGNKENRQLEWNQADNCTVAGGELVLTARREPVTSPSGERYDWTSCLISSAPSYAFQYGYIEERAILPGALGFWPAFWTWQAPDVNHYAETDVYEFYTDNRRELELTQHSGAKGRCLWRPPFDPTADWHTYAAAIEPSGTTWYVDGVKVCHTVATSDAPTNIVSNLAVNASSPPAASTDTAAKRVDYIRAWRRA
jgi:beta-glucanase (GH16 family)